MPLTSAERPATSTSSLPALRSAFPLLFVLFPPSFPFLLLLSLLLLLLFLLLLPLSVEYSLQIHTALYDCGFEAILIILVQKFNELLKPHMNDGEILAMVSKSEEFDQVKVWYMYIKLPTSLCTVHVQCMVCASGCTVHVQ